jgi:hypothetical protein
MSALTLSIPEGGINKAVCQQAVKAIETMLADRGRSLYDNIVIGEALVKIGEGLSQQSRHLLVWYIEDGQALVPEHVSGKFSYTEGAVSYDYGNDPELAELSEKLAESSRREAEAIAAHKAESEKLATAILARKQWLIANGSAVLRGKAHGQIRFTMNKGN